MAAVSAHRHRQNQHQQGTDLLAVSASPADATLRCSHAVAQLAAAVRVDARRREGGEAAVTAAEDSLAAAAAALAEPLRLVSTLGCPAAVAPVLLELTVVTGINEHCLPRHRHAF